MSPDPSVSGPRRTILVVDDDQGMRETLRIILDSDHRVLLADTGEIALQILSREAIDAMLLDVQLPGMDGLGVLRLVKQRYPLTEIIMISAVAEQETVMEAITVGAYHFIKKEFEYDTVRTLVQKAIDRRDLEQEVIALTPHIRRARDAKFRELFLLYCQLDAGARLSIDREIERLHRTRLMTG